LLHIFERGAITLGDSPKRTKVLHIITRFIGGGADENTLFTVNGLDKSRYDVHLMIGNTCDQAMIDRLDSRVRLITIEDMGREISPLKDMKALLLMRSMIKKERYDIIHTHTSKAGFLGRIAGHLCGCSIIIHGVHTIPFADVLQPRYNWLFLVLEKYAARFTKVFITVGEELKWRYIEKGVGSPERYCTIYSGMDLEEFSRAAAMTPGNLKELRHSLGVGDDDVCVGIVSRLEPGKGFAFFPSIVEEVIRRCKKVKFLIVGDGSMRGDLISQIGEKKLSDHVIFAGFRDDVAQVMASFDIAIFTSLLEGLPRAVVQYAIMGKPIVTFDVGGIREVVRDGENGYIIEKNAINDFAEKIAYIIETPPVWQSMRDKEKDFPRHLWSKDEMVERIDAVYQKALNSENPCVPAASART
jgi:glycosyltransferase involved in cell wall biosynthesis